MFRVLWSAHRGELFFYDAARRMPFPPNFWTLVTIAPVAAGFVSVSMKWWLAGVVFYSLAGVLDVADGMIARAQGKCTPLGAFLDGVVDRFSDFIIVMSFMFLPWPSWLVPQAWWVILLVFFSFMPAFVVAYATHRGALVDDEVMKWRILQRGDRFILFIAIVFFAVFSGGVSFVIAMLTLALSIATTFQAIFLVVLKATRPTTNSER